MLKFKFDGLLVRLRSRAKSYRQFPSNPRVSSRSGAFWPDPDSEGEDDGTSFVPLPRQMLDDLRVDLAVRIDASSIRR